MKTIHASSSLRACLEHNNFTGFALEKYAMFQTGPNVCNYMTYLSWKLSMLASHITIDMHSFIHVSILHNTLKFIHDPRNNERSMLLVALKSKSIHDYPIIAKALCLHVDLILKLDRKLTFMHKNITKLTEICLR